MEELPASALRDDVKFEVFDEKTRPMEELPAKANRDDVKLEGSHTKKRPEEAKVESTGLWAYNQYIELFIPTIVKNSAVNMMDTLTWLNTMSTEKQRNLTDFATGAISMTKDTVEALTKTTTEEYERITISLAEQGLSKTVQETAINTFTKAQELYAAAIIAANSKTAEVKNMAKLKQEEVLASQALVAARDWADATKKAVEESVVVTSAKEVGGDALKLAEESYNGALQFAEKKREEAEKLTIMYLSYTQKQMSFITESAQGKNLVERTQKLLDHAKGMSREFNSFKSAERLDASYKKASELVKLAQDWVTSVLGFQKEGKLAGEKRLAAHFDLVEALENEV